MRFGFIFLLWILGCFAAGPATTSLRGKLVVEEGKHPAIDAGGKRLALSGDELTTKVLKDDLLNGIDLEVLGHYKGPDRFVVDPMHLKALWVHRGGKRLRISYWCDVCYIRTYSPGKCWCCQKNTDLDPIDPDHEH